MESEIIKQTRNFIQWNFINGDTVTWFSNDVLEPNTTVRQLEEFSKEITAPLIKTIRSLEQEIFELKNLLGDYEYTWAEGEE